jgi:hypothetical protein
LKKHSKPSFKFAKKDKFIITKRDKDDKREKDGKKEEKKRDDAAKDKKRLKKKTKLGLGLPVEATTTGRDIFWAEKLRLCPACGRHYVIICRMSWHWL